MVKETKIISGSSFVTEWTYNSADLPVTMKYPDGEIVTTHYNNNMLPIDVIGANTYVSSMTYDSASRLRTRALGNELTQTYDYYAWNQQGGRLHTLVTGSLQNFIYVYDAVGNILSIADSVNSQTQTFDYDELDRLWHAAATGTSEQGGYAQETYTYDSATGNLASKGGVNYTAYDANHKHAVTNLSNGNSYAYDANGNMTSRNVGGQSFTLNYDAENRLVSVTGAATAAFVYDADSKQVKTTVNGITTVYGGNYYAVASFVSIMFIFSPPANAR